jgi:hypothetical protein
MKRHKITIEDKKHGGTLRLSLSESEFNLLQENMKKYPGDDNWALWEMMKNDKVCSKYHYYTICRNFYNLTYIKITFVQ